MKTLSTSGAKTGDRTDGRCGASSVTRRGTLPTVVLLAPCCSVCSGNMPRSKSDAHYPQVKYWSYLLPMATLKPPPPPDAFKLTEGSPKAKVAPVGCAVAPPISGLLSIEGIPVEGLVDTGASITCLGFAIWWYYRAQWGALKPFTNAVHGAHGKPLQIAGRTEHLDIQWGEARGRASFVVIIGLESPPCLIGMDIMRPLRVRIDVTAGTATPAQPDPRQFT